MKQNLDARALTRNTPEAVDFEAPALTGSLAARIAADLEWAHAEASGLSDAERVTLADRVLSAVALLSMRDGGTIDETKARDVASNAVIALVAPNEKLRATVDRMHRAIGGAETRGERAVIYEVELLVRSVFQWPANERAAKLAAALVKRWPKEAARVHVDDLDEWLADLAAKRRKPAGVVTRILLAMRWFGSETEKALLQRVSKALSVRAKR